jgi:hypothetical protein
LFITTLLIEGKLLREYRVIYFDRYSKIDPAMVACAAEAARGI